ncbi:unnamed protein product (mitochondrion) [Jaminaea pallidilutea]|uniref:NADH-ubiquinone oxidoreductase chain 6 n=1 Tax=Jaminaea pallidilutea TaxID=2878321 RepID=A0AB39A6X0_9BASI
MINLLLNILSVGAIISGILVITSKNPVISVLFLISVFLHTCGYLVLLGVGFIGISYLIVYVGAIAILFLFVVIMLNLQLQELSIVGKEYTQNLPLSLILGSVFLYEFTEILPFSFKDQSSFNITIIKEIIINFSLGVFNFINTKIISVIDFITKFTNKDYNNQNFITSQETINFNYINNNNTIYVAFNNMQVDENLENFIEIQSIAQIIYTNGIVWLILCSIILLLAIIAPITLTLNKQNKLYY